MAGGVLRGRTNVEHHYYLASLQPGGQFLAVDQFDTVSVAEVRARQSLQPGDVGAGHVTHRRPQFGDAFAGQRVIDTHTVAAGTATVTVQGAVTETYNATQTTTVTGGIDVTSKVHYHLTAATEIVFHVGGSQIKMDSGGKITITGTDITIDGSSKVTVQSGGSIIRLTPDAIQATATTVDITGKSKASLGASETSISGSAKVAISGGAVNSSAGGMHEITGAVVKIN